MRTSRESPQFSAFSCLLWIFVSHDSSEELGDLLKPLVFWKAKAAFTSQMLPPSSRPAQMLLHVTLTPQAVPPEGEQSQTAG